MTISKQLHVRRLEAKLWQAQRKYLFSTMKRREQNKLIAELKGELAKAKGQGQ